jgi:hypothetical protein
MRSSCALTPSQKNLVSREAAGRISLSGSRSSGAVVAGACRSAGMNFMMRHIISATSSSPTVQVIFWLTK